MENKQHPIQGVMDTAMQNIKEMVDVNTIIGTPINAPDGTMIIPVSKVGGGFASGGSDFTTKNSAESPNFGGGSGAGITISPIAFLVVSPKGEVSLMPISQPAGNAVDKIVDSVPGVIEQIKNIFGKKNEAEAEE